jgi:CheY-like chemotaxis protein
MIHTSSETARSAVAAASSMRTGPTRTQHARRQAPLTVLLVDDDPTFCQVTQLLLEVEGLSVRTAEDCEAALGLIEQGFRPEAVVADYQLPDGDGLDVVRRVRRALRRDVPAVFVTGDIAFKAPPQETARSRVLYKPVTPEELITVLEELKP